MIVDNLKNLINFYEDDMMTIDEFQIHAFNIIMHDQLQEVRLGNIVGVELTCCCGNGHTDNDYMECDLSIHPHGYSIEKRIIAAMINEKQNTGEITMINEKQNEENVERAFEEYSKKLDELKGVVNVGDEAIAKTHFEEMEKLSASIKKGLKKLKNNE